jgi:peroxiredoxin
MLQNSEVPKDFLRQIPDNLPIPMDDGLCSHLTGLSIPDVNLISTSGITVNLAQVKGLMVIYCYPKTGKPNHHLPEGWIQIPGAAGCTPQSCSFRDHYHEFQDLDVKVFGISTQSPEDQAEASQRLHLPFELLSDESFEFAEGLGLPIFEVEGRKLIKRVTLIVKDRRVVKYFYPIFPPDKNIDEVLAWFQSPNH